MTLCQWQRIYHVGATRDFSARNMRRQQTLHRTTCLVGKSMLGTILLILLIIALLGGFARLGARTVLRPGYYGGGGLGLLLLLVVVLLATSRV